MLVLPPELTHHQAAACLRMLEQTLPSLSAQQQQVVVDASQLQQFDSSALAVLLACRRAAARRNQTLAVQGLPSGLASLAELYGIAELLPTPNAASAAP